MEFLHVYHGYKDLPIENVYTASYLSSLYLKQNLAEGEKVYVIGEQGFRDQLIE